MIRELILGTAGHIDHGKTALVKALTGADCDRLPEEKARGITIDIGFASLELGDARFGIVDVPGHEKFIKNMLAGASGIDLALLVVAADDSVMPQTLEHVEILKLLNIREGVIAITKCDLVDDLTLVRVKEEVRGLVAGSFLERAPIIPVSSLTGNGIAQLKDTLREIGERFVVENSVRPFRMAIDRAFTLQGHGTIVTGSVSSGSVRVGAELGWHRGGGVIDTVRVRGLSNHGRPVDELHRGQRGAINLAGVERESIRRGQELGEIGRLTPSRILTVQLIVPRSCGTTIKHRLPVRLHIGTDEIMAVVSLLDRERAETGQTALAQLFLNEPATVEWGRPFVLRDSSAEHTLCGGRVLQVVAAKLRRTNLDALERVEQLTDTAVSSRIEAAAWLAGFSGIRREDLIRDAGVEPADIETIVAERIAAGALTVVDDSGRILHQRRTEEVEAKILDVLAALHAENPLATTHPRAKVASRLGFIGNAELIEKFLDRLLRAKKLVGDRTTVARADFKPKLSINQRKLKDKIVEEFRKAACRPPDPKSYAGHVGGRAEAIDEILEVACAEGLLVRISEGFYLHTEAEAEVRRRVVELTAQTPGVTIAEIRDALDTTRKYAVPLCEYLDRLGVTRREGDLRVAGFIR